MGRALGDAKRAGTGPGSNQEIDEDRIIDRFKRLGRQRRALQVTLRPFGDGERLDPREWEQGFTSADPEVIAQVVAVTGAYQMLVNHLMEMLQAAGRLAGLEACRGNTRPSGPDLIKAVVSDGGLTDHQMDVLLRLYRTRNALQHSSPGVQANDLREDIELLQKTLVRFVKSYLDWLKRYEVHIVPDQ